MIYSPESPPRNGQNNEENQTLDLSKLGIPVSADRASVSTPTPPPSQAFRSLPLSSRTVPSTPSQTLVDCSESRHDASLKANLAPDASTFNSLKPIPTLVDNSLSRAISEPDLSTLVRLKSAPIAHEVLDTESSNESSAQSVTKMEADQEKEEKANDTVTLREEQVSGVDQTETRNTELEVNEGSISSRTNTILPRRFSENSSNASKKLIGVDFNANAGSRSPSVLSSQEDYSSKDSNEIEKDMLRMKHLGFLLDKHHRRISGMNAGVWASDNESLNISSEISNSTDEGKEELRSDNILQKIEDTSKSLESRSGSHSTVKSSKINKDSSSSLFENFDKAWLAIHHSTDDETELSSVLKLERLCFATTVHMLLRQYKEQNNMSKRWGSIPVHIVKLFWRKVILIDTHSEEDTHFTQQINNIMDVLTERLRYMKIQESGNDDSPILSLSHEVYAQYGQYIFECDGILQKQIDEWNVIFACVLQDILLQNKNNDDMDLGNEMEVHPVIKKYAVTSLPIIIVNSMTKILPDAIGQQALNRGLYEKECLSRLVVLLQNKTFLEYRIEVLGNRKGDISHLSAPVKYDIMKATSIHVKDLENIASIISKKTDYIMVGDDAYDITRAVVTLYTAWREICCTEMNKARVCVHDENKIASTHADSCEHGSSPQLLTRRFKKSGANSMSMPYSQACLTWKPRQLLPAAGEYELDVKVSNIKPAANDRSRGKGIPRNRGLRKFAEETRPSMPLSDVLKIDIDILSFETTIAKALYLLGESLASITSSKSLCFNRPAGRTVGLLLTGAMGCTSKLNHCASALEMYMRLANVVGFLLSDDLHDVDEDDLVDLGFNYEDTSGLDPSTRMKMLIKDRERAAELMRQLDVLIAESFFALGNHLLCGIQLGQGDVIDMAGIRLLGNLTQPSFTSSNDDTKEVNGKPSDRAKILQCYELSLQFLRLGIPKSDNDTDVAFLGLDNSDKGSYEAELDMVKVHQRILYNAVLHAIGIHYYEQVGNFDVAKKYLDACVEKRQILLRQLRQDEADSGNISTSSTGSVIGARRRRSYGNYGLDGSRHMSESSVTSSRRVRRRSKPKHGNKIGPQGLCNDVSNTSFLLLGNGKSHKDCVDSIELDLSSTMEFSALATHALSDSESALSFFQEALILRALHSGKNSLDVADLQYNMGVIHDDLGQYEASLGRYGESLRVRHSHLEQLKVECSNSSVSTGIVDEIEDIEASVVLTLRCMTNVYHALKDFSNAISTNLKAIEVLKGQLKRQRNEGIYSQHGSVLGFGRMKGDASAVPLPKLIYDEYRPTLSKSLLPSPTKQPDGPSREHLSCDDDVTRNEISTMYTHILSLLDEIKEQEGNNGNTSSGYNSTTSSARSFLADHHSMANVVGTRHINREHVQLDSSFHLGIIAMYFGEHKKAVGYLEEALRTLWTSFPGDSSGSDSDASSSNLSADSSAEMRTKSRKIYAEGQAEEGILYHALAICHTALSDNERAIRCHITALRYYRKRFGMLSIVVSGALYDCAACYWSLCDFRRAEDFWADCLRILLSHDKNDERNFATMLEVNIARTLYNIAATKVCQGEYFNEYTTTCLYDSVSLFRKQSSKEGIFSEEVAHAYFNLGLIYYNRDAQRKKGQICSEERDDPDSFKVLSTYYAESNRAEDLKLAISCVDDALNSYLSNIAPTEIISQAEIGQNVQHPMQALVALLTGLINNAAGSVTQATWNFKTAIRLLNKIYSSNNLYSASAHDNLGDLLIGIGATEEALKNYEECLNIRIHLLGRKDASVGDALLKISGILVDSSKFDQALEMQRECLQIRLEIEGSYGDGVATILFRIGILCSRRGELRKAQDYLEGALKVRNSRVAAKEGGDQNADTKSGSAVDTAHKYNPVKGLSMRSEESELASILHHTGNVYLKLEDTATAMYFYEQALSYWNRLCDFGTGGLSEFVQRECTGDRTPAFTRNLRDMADTLHNMGGVYETKSDFSRALNYYNQALIIKRNLLVVNNVETKKTTTTESQPAAVGDYILSSKTLSSAITLLRIGAIHVVLQNYEVALSYYKSALKIQRQHLGRDHIAVAQTLYEIGITLRRMMKFTSDMRALDIVNMEKAAVKYFKDSLKIAQHRYGSNHEIVASVMFDIGSIHDCKGDYSEAISCYQHSVRVYGRVYARTLCRELFDIIPADDKFEMIVDDSHGLFHPRSESGFITNPFLDSAPNRMSQQIQARSQATLNEKGRDAYLKASIALAKAASQSDIITSGSSMIEITFFRIIHYIVIYGVDPAKTSLKNIISSIFGSTS